MKIGKTKDYLIFLFCCTFEEKWIWSSCEDLDKKVVAELFSCLQFVNIIVKLVNFDKLISYNFFTRVC